MNSKQTTQISELRTKNKEHGTWNKEQGTRNQEQGTKNKKMDPTSHIIQIATTMAIIQKSGLLTGRLGNKRFSVKNGKQVVRDIAPKKHTKPQTPAQVKAQQKLKMANQLGSQLKEVIHAGYQAAGRKTAYNEFISHLYRDAFCGSYPFQVIDLTKLKLARGTIPSPYLIVAEIVNGKLELTWKMCKTPDGCHGMDQMVLALINSNGQAYKSLCIAYREDEKATIDLPEGFTNNFYAWAFYYYPCGQKENLNKVSDSVFLGKF